jgi:hypothetical protein
MANLRKVAVQLEVMKERAPAQGSILRRDLAGAVCRLWQRARFMSD